MRMDKGIWNCLMPLSWDDGTCDTISDDVLGRYFPSRSMRVAKYFVSPRQGKMA